MQILNLNPAFAPLGKGTIIDASRPFPSRIERNIQLVGIEPNVPATIVARFDVVDMDVMKLLLATDALRQGGVSEIHLMLPFLPYARQDRLEEAWVGQSFALKMFATLLNSQQYASVQVLDPHSMVASALIDRLRVIPTDSFLAEVFKDAKDYVLVSPDAGAAKKIKHCAEVIGYTGVPVQALKYRTLGGSVDSIRIFETDLGGKDAYIVDDLCDGGATFIALAAELRARNVGRILLVVSHGIFSRGVSALVEGGVDHIFTTDSFKDQETHPHLTEIKLCTILT